MTARCSSGDELQLPPGFRFHPTDEELVTHYLCRKCAAMPITVPIIAEIDLYKFDPWQLPGMALYGEKEWYFFSPRDRKYPNGSRPNRAAGSGYWKATGADKPVGKPNPLAIKKALVFYAGKAPRGVKTNWIMHEYRLANVDRSAGKRTNLRLDDWVLCRIYNKKGSLDKQFTIDQKSALRSVSSPTSSDFEDQKPLIQPPPPQPSHIMKTQFGTNEIPNNTYHHQQPLLPPQYNTHPHSHQQQHHHHQQKSMMTMNDLFHFDKSDSVPRCHTTTDSSGSDHVLSPEVQSEPPKWNDLDSFGLDYMDSFSVDPFSQQVVGGVGMQQQQQQNLSQQGLGLMSPLQDVFLNFR